LYSYTKEQEQRLLKNIYEEKQKNKKKKKKKKETKKQREKVNSHGFLEKYN